MARVMTPDEYQEFINKALEIATKGLELPGGVKVTIEPRIQIQLPDDWASNKDRVAVYQKFVDDLNVVMNAMQLQIHMMAGSTAAAPDVPEYRDHFPITWFQEYRRWFDEVVKPVRKSIEDIEAAQNVQREEEIKRVRESVQNQTRTVEPPPETMGRDSSSAPESY